MTAQALDTATVADRELPSKKEYVVERPRFPLVLKLFLVTALLISIVVAVAVGITIERANRVASETVNASISGAAKLFKELEKQRLGRLALPTVLLGQDSTFVAYIQAALKPVAPAGELPGPIDPVAPATPADAPAPAIDYLSIDDQLEQRREAFGSDLVILLDDQGRSVARTDQQTVTGAPPSEDLYERLPLVKKVVDDASLEWTSGVMTLDNKLYHGVVAPVAAGQPRVRVAYLVNAVAIDEQFANRIAESTNAGVAFAAKGSGTGARSTNAPSVAMQMAGAGAEPSTVTIDGSRYVRIAEPLRSGNESVGSAIFLRSLDRELAPFREIEKALFIGGGAALFLALIFSWLIAKRMTRPIEQLAGMAQAVTAGDYSVQPNINRTDEVGILGRSFAKMINSLRDKAELEELYEQMANRTEEAAPARPVEAARNEEGTVLVTDLRGLLVGETEATTLVASIERLMRVQEAEVRRQDGEVREILGHRLVAIFRGDRGIIHAIRAARAINEELATQKPPMTLGVGIATGEFVTGSVSTDRDGGRAIIGNAPQIAMLFAWHAPAGYAYVSYETAQSAGGEVLSTATRREVKLDWLAQPLPVAALPLVSVTTGMMRSIGDGNTASMATLRLDSMTAAGQTAPGSPQMDLSVGHMFATRYRIEQILGRGGMGVVYRANDTQLDETVAIKTLPGDVMQRSPEDLERFKREIRLARKITHRNVLRTFDYGEAEGVYFISMEYVRGYTLSELLDEAPSRQMAPRVTAGISRQISRGLHAAHEQGIIHRDIKPGNVLIDAKGEVKLMDFGIARMAEAAEANMTQAGLIVGTPHYMSPEQVQGRQLDARSDVYSMGILMYEMLVGKRPFESSSLTGILAAHITEQPKPITDLRPDLPRELAAIVMKCLVKDPKARYADAGALLADLDRVQVPAAAAA